MKNKKKLIDVTEFLSTRGSVFIWSIAIIGSLALNTLLFSTIVYLTEVVKLAFVW